MHAIRIEGVSGGVGASTLAAHVAHLWARSVGQVALVDADPIQGQADHALVAEHLPGLRWGDLAAVEGAVDGPAVVARLPAAAGVSVLAGDGSPVPPSVVSEVVEALGRSVVGVVIDGGRLGSGEVPRTPVVLVGAVGAVQVAALTRRVRAMDEPPVGLVLRAGRGRRGLAGEVADHLGVPLCGVLANDPGVSRAAERGSLAMTRELRRAAAGVLELVLGAPRGWR